MAVIIRVFPRDGALCMERRQSRHSLRAAESQCGSPHVLLADSKCTAIIA